VQIEKLQRLSNGFVVLQQKNLRGLCFFIWQTSVFVDPLEKDWIIFIFNFTQTLWIRKKDVPPRDLHRRGATVTACYFIISSVDLVFCTKLVASSAIKLFSLYAYACSNYTELKIAETHARASKHASFHATATTSACCTNTDGDIR